MERKIKDPHEAALSFQMGEEAGFNFFWNKLYNSLSFYVFKFVRDRDVAKDIVSESFIRAWDNRNGFTHEKQIKSWLFTTCYNQSRNYYKSQNKFSDEPIPEKGYIPVNETIMWLEHSIMFAALETLPKKRRRIVEMRYLQEKSVREICNELNLKNSSVKSHLANGIAQLRKKFDLDDDYIEQKKIRWIKAIYFSLGRYASTANLYGCSFDTVVKIRSGQSYKEITSKLP